MKLLNKLLILLALGAKKSEGYFPDLVNSTKNFYSFAISAANGAEYKLATITKIDPTILSTLFYTVFLSTISSNNEIEKRIAKEKFYYITQKKEFRNFIRIRHEDQDASTLKKTSEVLRNNPQLLLSLIDVREMNDLLNPSEKIIESIASDITGKRTAESITTHYATNKIFSYILNIPFNHQATSRPRKTQKNQKILESLLSKEVKEYILYHSINNSIWDFYWAIPTIKRVMMRSDAEGLGATGFRLYIESAFGISTFSVIAPNKLGIYIDNNQALSEYKKNHQILMANTEKIMSQATPEETQLLNSEESDSQESEETITKEKGE